MFLPQASDYLSFNPQKPENDEDDLLKAEAARRASAPPPPMNGPTPPAAGGQAQPPSQRMEVVAADEASEALLHPEDAPKPPQPQGQPLPKTGAAVAQAPLPQVQVPAFKMPDIQAPRHLTPQVQPAPQGNAPGSLKPGIEMPEAQGPARRPPVVTHPYARGEGSLSGSVFALEEPVGPALEEDAMGDAARPAEDEADGADDQRSITQTPFAWHEPAAQAGEGKPPEDAAGSVGTGHDGKEAATAADEAALTPGETRLQATKTMVQGRGPGVTDGPGTDAAPPPGVTSALATSTMAKGHAEAKTGEQGEDAAPTTPEGSLASATATQVKGPDAAEPRQTQEPGGQATAEPVDEAEATRRRKEKQTRDQEQRQADPQAWENKQVAEAAGRSKDELETDVATGLAQIAQRKQALDARKAALERETGAGAEEQRRFELENAHAIANSKDLRGVVIDPATGRHWDSEVLRRRDEATAARKQSALSEPAVAAEAEAIKREEQELGRDTRVLSARSAELDKRLMGERVKGRGEERKAGEVEAKKHADFGDKIERQQPGAKAKYEAIRQDFAKQQEALNAKYPGGAGSSPEAKAEWEKLVQDTAVRSQGLMDEVNKGYLESRTKALDAAQAIKARLEKDNAEDPRGQHGVRDMLSPGNWTETREEREQRFERNRLHKEEVIAEEMRKQGLDPEHPGHKELMEDAKKMDWSDAVVASDEGGWKGSGGVEHAMKGIGRMLISGKDSTAEATRILSDGTLLVNPMLVQDTGAYTAAVQKSTASEEAKAAAWQQLPGMQVRQAEQMIGALKETPEWLPGEHFNSFMQRREADPQYGEWFRGLSPGEQAREYFKEQQNRDGFVKTMDYLATHLVSGVTQVAAMGLGLAGMVTGGVPIVGEAVSKLAGELSDSAGKMTATSDAEAGAGAGLRIAGMVTEMAPAAALSFLTGGGTLGMVMAGATAAGGQYAENYSAMRKQGISHETAWKTQATGALATGLVTGLITRLGGLQGVSSKAGRAMLKESMESLWTSVPKNLLKDGAKEFLIEEMPSEIITTIISAVSRGENPEKQLEQLFNGSPEMGATILAMGGLTKGGAALKNKVSGNAKAENTLSQAQEYLRNGKLPEMPPPMKGDGKSAAGDPPPMAPGTPQGQGQGGVESKPQVPGQPDTSSGVPAPSAQQSIPGTTIPAGGQPPLGTPPTAAPPAKAEVPPGAGAAGAPSAEVPASPGGKGSAEGVPGATSAAPASSAGVGPTPEVQQAYDLLQTHGNNPDAKRSDADAQALDRARKVLAEETRKNLQRKLDVTKKDLPPPEAKALADALATLGGANGKADVNGNADAQVDANADANMDGQARDGGRHANPETNSRKGGHPDLDANVDTDTDTDADARRNKGRDAAVDAETDADPRQGGDGDADSVHGSPRRGQPHDDNLPRTPQDQSLPSNAEGRRPDANADTDTDADAGADAGNPMRGSRPPGVSTSTDGATPSAAANNVQEPKAPTSIPEAATSATTPAKPSRPPLSVEDSKRLIANVAKMPPQARQHPTVQADLAQAQRVVADLESRASPAPEARKETGKSDSGTKAGTVGGNHSVQSDGTPTRNKEEWAKRFKSWLKPNPAKARDAIQWRPAHPVSPELQRRIMDGAQSLLDMLPPDIITSVGPVRVEVRASLRPGVPAQYFPDTNTIAFSHDQMGGHNPEQIRKLMWHEMAHWLYDRAGKTGTNGQPLSQRLREWRDAIDSHWDKRIQGEPIGVDPVEKWRYIRDGWVNNYVGRLYPGARSGLELPAIYFEEAAVGPLRPAWLGRTHSAAQETFDIVLSIFIN